MKTILVISLFIGGNVEIRQVEMPDLAVCAAVRDSLGGFINRGKTWSPESSLTRLDCVNVQTPKPMPSPAAIDPSL